MTRPSKLFAGKLYKISLGTPCLIERGDASPRPSNKIENLPLLEKAYVKEDGLLMFLKIVRKKYRNSYKDRAVVAAQKKKLYLFLFGTQIVYLEKSNLRYLSRYRFNEIKSKN